MDKLQILVADCSSEVASLFQNALEEANFEVSSVGGEDVRIDCFRQFRPDLLVLGIHFSAHNSWDLIRILRSDTEYAELPIVLISTRAIESEELLALELGADEYMSQPLNPIEVIARVRALLRRAVTRKRMSKAQVLMVGDLQLHKGRHQVIKQGNPIDLTPIEFDTLQTLMSRPGYVFSRPSLLEMVTGNASQMVERTLDSHIKNLRRKLDDDPKTPLYIETVFGVGYRMPDPS